MRVLVALLALTSVGAVLSQGRTVTAPTPLLPRYSVPGSSTSAPASPPPSPAQTPSGAPESPATAPASPPPSYTMPFAGWSAKDIATWGADSGACLVHEEKYAQDFPAFSDVDDAQKFAVRLQQVLYARKLTSVVTQPVERAGSWGVLASYQFTSGGDAYKVTQLYLSDSGKLRTFTGSARSDSLDQCVNDMLSFVRYLAN